MKIAVTGGSGFVGSRIEKYYRNNYEVFTPTHSEMDITNKESVRAYLEKVNPDIIVHCAAVSDVGACDREPEKSWEINVTGSENIAEIARNTGAKCIMCSSDQVYFGSPVKIPHSEEEKLEPVNEYGRQKLAMERKCLQINPDSVMLRLSWMYDVKKRNEQEHSNFMVNLLDDIRENKEMYFPVYDMRGITNVSDVIKNMEKAFHLPGGIYNFGSCNDKNTYEMMKTVFRTIRQDKLSLLHENTEAFVHNNRNISMNTDKIKSRGITFPTTAEGITEVLKRI